MAASYCRRGTYFNEWRIRCDFQAHGEGLAAEREFGERGLVLCERVFWAWEAFLHIHDRRQLKRTVRRLRHHYKPLRTYAGKSPRLLSASITRRLQHRSLFAYMTEPHARCEPLPLP
jgi:hypothetical protein